MLSRQERMIERKLTWNLFPRNSRLKFGMEWSFAIAAIAIGGVRDIDAVNVDTLEALATELGMKRGALRQLAHPMADNVEGAISRAGSGKEGAVFASTPPYVADDLVEEMQPRLGVLREFCRR